MPAQQLSAAMEKAWSTKIVLDFFLQTSLCLRSQNALLWSTTRAISCKVPWRCMVASSGNTRARRPEFLILGPSANHNYVDAMVVCLILFHFSCIFHALGYTVAQWLACWAANSEVWGSNPGHGRNLVRDFCSTCAPSQLSYDEYTDCTLSASVGRWDGEGEDWPPALICWG